MSAFFMVGVTIKNDADFLTYNRYLDEAKPVIESFGGQFAIRSEQVTLVSDGWLSDGNIPGMIIVTQFSNLALSYACLANGKARYGRTCGHDRSLYQQREGRYRFMSKYDPLWKHLQTNGSPTLRLSFEEIKAVLGFSIDHSFLTYKEEAAAYGYQVGKISMKEQHVTFQKRRLES